MKILLNYDQTSGQISDKDMNPIFCFLGLQNHEHTENNKNETSNTPSEVVKLVSMGITADELLKLKANGLV